MVDVTHKVMGDQGDMDHAQRGHLSPLNVPFGSITPTPGTTTIDELDAREKYLRDTVNEIRNRRENRAAEPVGGKR
jgi:hypothetical protein